MEAYTFSRFSTVLLLLTILVSNLSIYTNKYVQICVWSTTIITFNLNPSITEVLVYTVAKRQIETFCHIVASLSGSIRLYCLFWMRVRFRTRNYTSHEITLVFDRYFYLYLLRHLTYICWPFFHLYLQGHFHLYLQILFLETFSVYLLKVDGFLWVLWVLFIV